MLRKPKFNIDETFGQLAAEGNKTAEHLDDLAFKPFDETIQEHAMHTLASIDAQSTVNNMLEDEDIRNKNIEILAQNIAKETVSKHGEYLTQIVNDTQNGCKNKSAKERHEYVADHHGKEVAPGIASNHCLIVQMAALNKANKDLGSKIAEQLSMFNVELENQNILQIKTKYQRDVGEPIHEGVADTLGMGANFRNRDFMNKFGNSEYMENVAVSSNVTRTGFADFKHNGYTCSYNVALKNKAVKLHSYVDANGYVKKDEQGKPLLKDGDFAFVNTSHGNSNSSGFHVIRLNVAEDGKVTYTAGNNERVNAKLGSFLNAPCAIFHTQDYIADCIREQYKDRSNKEIMELAAKEYPDQAIKADYQELTQKYYEERVQEKISSDHARKQEALTTAHEPTLSDAEKILALRGRTSCNHQVSSNNGNQRTPQKFNAAEFRKLQSLRGYS